LFASVILSLAGNFTGGSGSGASETQFNFSYQQSGYYPVQAFSYRLNQGYFVSQYAAHELRRDPNKKYRMDERVENDVLRRVQAGCDDAKKMRTQYINLSKRYSHDTDQYEMYISVSNR
jgi:Domain of unknown function (DUF1977)